MARYHAWVDLRDAAAEHDPYNCGCQACRWLTTLYQSTMVNLLNAVARDRLIDGLGDLYEKYQPELHHKVAAKATYLVDNYLTFNPPTGRYFEQLAAAILPVSDVALTEGVEMAVIAGEEFGISPPRFGRPKRQPTLKYLHDYDRLRSSSPKDRPA